MQLEKYKSPYSRLDLDVSAAKDISLRGSGFPADAVSTGIAVAIVVVGMGISWAVSEGRKLFDD